MPITDVHLIKAINVENKEQVCGAAKRITACEMVFCFGCNDHRWVVFQICILLQEQRFLWYFTAALTNHVGGTCDGHNNGHRTRY